MCDVIVCVCVFAGKFDVAEVIRAAQHIESEQRKSKGLRWLIAAMCVIYLITIGMMQPPIYPPTHPHMSTPQTQHKKS